MSVAPKHSSHLKSHPHVLKKPDLLKGRNSGLQGFALPKKNGEVYIRKQNS